MSGSAGGWRGFAGGLLTGALSALVMTLALLYVLNMLGVVALSVIQLPQLHDLLHWTYSNLRLSVIPFGLILLLYVHFLRRLHRDLQGGAADPERVGQSEHWIDISTSLFFGTGVIWTAIGMRSALLHALNGLDAGTAMQLGAFEILRRLVDGGILLALSTTIVGAVGGYLMRLVKTALVGTRLNRHYEQLARADSDTLKEQLRRIEQQLARLGGGNAAPPDPAPGGRGEW